MPSRMAKRYALVYEDIYLSIGFTFCEVVNIVCFWCYMPVCCVKPRVGFFMTEYAFFTLDMNLCVGIFVLIDFRPYKRSDQFFYGESKFLVLKKTARLLIT